MARLHTVTAMDALTSGYIASTRTTTRSPSTLTVTGGPTLSKRTKDSELVRVESDRNFDGQVDLVQEYSRGVLIRELHDDDFDGKIETIKDFRNGKLAMVERDPKERGHIDIVEYYDDAGKLIRLESRHEWQRHDGTVR